MQLLFLIAALVFMWPFMIRRVFDYFLVYFVFFSGFFCFDQHCFIWFFLCILYIFLLPPLRRPSCMRVSVRARVSCVCVLMRINIAGFDARLYFSYQFSVFFLVCSFLDFSSFCSCFCCFPVFVFFGVFLFLFPAYFYNFHFIVVCYVV